MTYSKLDSWDIKRLENNMNDRESLFLVIDDLVCSYSQHDYELGYTTGFDEGYDQALLDKECE